VQYQALTQSRYVRLAFISRFCDVNQNAKLNGANMDTTCYSVSRLKT